MCLDNLVHEIEGTNNSDCEKYIENSEFSGTDAVADAAVLKLISESAHIFVHIHEIVNIECNAE